MNEKRHLLIVDEVPARLPRWQAGVVWDILGLGQTREELETALLSRAMDRDDLRVVDSRAWAGKAATQVRKFVVPLIDGLPERKLGDGRPLGSLLGQRNGLNDWWFLELSEKSPLRGSLIQELYQLALIRSVTRERPYRSVKWAARNGALRNVVAGGLELPVSAAGRIFSSFPSCWMEWLYYVCAVRAWVRNMGLKVIARVAGWREVQPPQAPAIFSVFPAWWSDAGTLQAKDRFFSFHPAPAGGGRAGGPVYLVWWSAGLRRTWRLRKVWKTLVQKKRFMVLSRHIPAKAWRELFAPASFFRLRTFRQALGHVAWPKFQGFEITRLLQKEVSRSIGGGELTTGRLLSETLQTCAARWGLPELRFRFEGQPIDRALLLGIRGVSRSVGFWHSPLARGPNYLPLLPTKGTFQPGFQATRWMPLPLPDVFMACGQICRKSLLNSGYPPDQIRPCKPLRSEHLLKFVKGQKPRALLRTKKDLEPGLWQLFLAGSVSPKENRGMIHALLNALGGLPSLVLFFRAHPTRPFPENLLRALGRHPKVANILPATAASYLKHLATSRVLVSGGSSIVFEAMALGVMPVVYESPAEFSPSSLRGFADSLFVARSSRELSRGITDVLSRGPIYRNRQKKWPSLCRAIYGNQFLT